MVLDRHPCRIQQAGSLRRGGGRIVAEVTPEDVAKVKESYTGQYLKQLLGRRSNARGKKEAAE